MNPNYCSAHGGLSFYTRETYTDTMVYRDTLLSYISSLCLLITFTWKNFSLSLNHFSSVPTFFFFHIYELQEKYELQVYGSFSLFTSSLDLYVFIWSLLYFYLHPQLQRTTPSCNFGISIFVEDYFISSS